ncbi:hypothetical protein GN958_ATG11512 [Phytophthora infestans]|uniref:Transposase IS30-like HTH domain-containing protein n=1 Tax=Phytophthora infestans TaxID=4787 RepID=A0A8S9UFI3_PHYIN|nr:hypothetical protein GN958_ATG11512 [Phytophthora infestans]
MHATKKPPSKKKNSRLPDRKWEKIEELHVVGPSFDTIAKKFKRCAQTVRRVVISPRPSVPPNKTKPLGRAPVLSNRETRSIVRTAAMGNLSAIKLKKLLGHPITVRW